ncbi:MAG: amidase [Nocardioides sp.]|nr:amidase [Nocardioides sp.]
MTAPTRQQTVTAWADDALGTDDAVGLADRLRRGAVSAPELVEAAIARVEAVDGPLNALAFRAFDRARVDAQDPGTAYFAGVPSVLKDNVDVAGMPTRQGTDAWQGRPAPRDGDLARMYLATGLVPLGKSQLSEFGFSAAAEHPRLGAVRSPWSTAHVAGASSAGSAGLVASGALPIAHANDGGGSIRIPAAVNGLVGLKPTRGRFAQDALLRRMPVRIVSDGVVTRSVRDTAAFFREAEKVFHAVGMPPVGDLTRAGRRRLRVGLTTAGAGVTATPEVAAATREVGLLLESLGHEVEEVDAPVPDGFRDDFLLYWATTALALVRGGRRMHGRSWDVDRLDPLTRGLARHAERRLHKVPGAVRRLRRSQEVTDGFYARHDVLLSPTLAHPTPLVGHLDPTQGFDVVMDRLLEWVAFTPLQNATGEPAISLPLAGDGAGLPLGVMVAGPRGTEGRLIGLAYELEEARPFARLV